MTSMVFAGKDEVPVAHEADIAVFGGGPGGLGAAVMAARCGADVLLIERFGLLGGMAVIGEVHPFMSNHAHAVCLDRPVYVEWIQRMRAYYPKDDPAAVLSSDDVSEPRDKYIPKDVAALAAEDLCLEAGVRLLYHHTLVDAAVTRDAIDAAVVWSKSGYTAIRAKQYIDCTGDADLAARAGCPFEQGGPTGHSQPMTLCFKVNKVDLERVPARDEFNRLYREAKERGEMDCPRDNLCYFEWVDGDVIHFNTTRVIHKSGTEGVDLSEAEIEARRQMRQYLDWLRKRVPGFEKARVYSMAHQIGVRETRRVQGKAYLERDSFVNHEKFPDAIARCRYAIDIHDPDGGGTEIVAMEPGEWYEIPYGCIVPEGARNLLVGGRPISVDHAIHSSMRVMPPACSIGQAAGVAAAMALSRGVAPGELDGVEVREKLISMGANLAQAAAAAK